MTNRAIRVLPFPPVERITTEIVAQIKAIPDEDIEYSIKEIAWMHRSLENLDYMQMEAERLELSETLKHIAVQKAWIEGELRDHERQVRRRLNDTR